VAIVSTAIVDVNSEGQATSRPRNKLRLVVAREEFISWRKGSVWQVQMVVVVKSFA
jgi:hypothetical protein